MPFAMITAPVVSVAGNTTAGRRTAAKSASLRTTSESAVSFSTPKRGKTIIPSAFGFGKKAAPEPEEEEEEEPEDFTDGNPFASVGGKVMGALEDSPKLKMPSLGGFNFPGTQDEDPSFDEYGDEDETPDAPSGGNPFASFGGFGTVGKTIDQTVDLDYEDDEEEEEEKEKKRRARTRTRTSLPVGPTIRRLETGKTSSKKLSKTNSTRANERFCGTPSTSADEWLS